MYRKTNSYFTRWFLALILQKKKKKNDSQCYGKPRLGDITLIFPVIEITKRKKIRWTATIVLVSYYRTTSIVNLVVASLINSNNKIYVTGSQTSRNATAVWKNRTINNYYYYCYRRPSIKQYYVRTGAYSAAGSRRKYAKRCFWETQTFFHTLCVQCFQHRTIILQYDYYNLFRRKCVFVHIFIEIIYTVHVIVYIDQNRPAIRLGIFQFFQKYAFAHWKHLKNYTIFSRWKKIKYFPWNEQRRSYTVFLPYTVFTLFFPFYWNIKPILVQFNCGRTTGYGQLLIFDYSFKICFVRIRLNKNSVSDFFCFLKFARIYVPWLFLGQKHSLNDIILP